MPLIWYPYEYSCAGKPRRNTQKKVRGNYGEFEIDVPQDRNSTFEPQVVKKRQKDILDIDSKIISMYTRGLTTRQISEQTEKWSGKYPNAMKIWDVLTPIFKFSADVHKVIYTTNAIESLNSTCKKLNRQRSVFPSDTAVTQRINIPAYCRLTAF